VAGAGGYAAAPMPDVSARNRILVEIDRTLCFGFGDCVDTVPAVFALDEESKAAVLDPDAASVELIIEAAQNCPVDAIIVTDEQGAQLYP
jgi:ferredoxin